MKILLKFHDAEYLVTPATADRVVRTLPRHRYTAIPIEEPDPPLPSHRAGSVFDRVRKDEDELSPNQHRLAQKLSKRMTPQAAGLQVPSAAP